MTRPEPFNDRNETDRFWETGRDAYEDFFDPFLPRPGFITDFIYRFRGTEVPSIFTTWGALFTLSSAIKREGWIRWADPSQFFANLYVLFVGAPGLTKKTTMVERSLELLGDFHHFIEDENLKKIKKINTLKNKATPEAILEAMIPKNGFILKNDDNTNMLNSESGKVLRYPGSSSLAMAIHEMSVMINKQRYSESLIQNLLDLYDCHSTWEWRTRGEGKKELRNLFTTLLSGTTIESFRESIPKAAAGDGFLSRCIIAYAPIPNREFFMPRTVEFGPSIIDLKKRLAYICEVMQGPFDLTKQAKEWGREWYHDFRERVRSGEYDAGTMSRMNINMLKVAFLLKAQSYPDYEDRSIEVRDLKEAERILRATYLISRAVVDEVRSADDMLRNVGRVKNYIMERGTVVRSSLLGGTRVTSQELNLVLNHLVSEGSIQVTNVMGEPLERPQGRTSERYKFIGESISSIKIDEDKNGKKTNYRHSAKGKNPEGVRSSQVSEGIGGSPVHGSEDGTESVSGERSGLGQVPEDGNIHDKTGEALLRV